MNSADSSLGGTPTPLVSVLLLTYRQECFVAQALASLLAQDWPSMEILVLDDASPDGTLAAVERLLASHPRRSLVRIMPSSQNLGLAANWNRGVAAAAGDIVVAAAGDDISAPSRIRESADYLCAHPDVHAVYFNCRVIDEAGVVRRDPWRQVLGSPRRTLGHPELWKGFPFHGATAAYRASTLRFFGPIDPRCGTEDVPSLMRAQLAGHAAVLPAVLVDWRWHGANLSHGGLAPGIARSQRLKTKARRAKGAVYDALQLQRDAATAVHAGFRPAREVAVLLATCRRMELVNRLKFHALHPRSRWLVCLSLARRIAGSADIPRLEAAWSVMRLLFRRAVPSRIRHWSV